MAHIRIIHFTLAAGATIVLAACGAGAEVAANRSAAAAPGAMSLMVSGNVASTEAFSGRTKDRAAEPAKPVPGPVAKKSTWTSSDGVVLEDGTFAHYSQY